MYLSLFTSTHLIWPLCLTLRPPFPELHQTQPVAEPLLPESGPLPGRAGQRELLARGFGLRGQTGGAGLQEAAAAGRGLLQDAVRASVFQVSSLPAVVWLALWGGEGVARGVLVIGQGLTLSPPSLCFCPRLSFDGIEQSKFTSGSVCAAEASGTAQECC